jgi:hypothetical protein
VLVLVRHAVQELGRAIRSTDAIAFAEGKPEYSQLSPTVIQDAMPALHRKGELIGQTMRGAHHKLYLPADLKPEDYAPHEPLSCLEWVKLAFDELWDERLREAQEQDRLPRPITTKEVRKRLVSLCYDDPRFFENRAFVINGLWELSKHSNASLRLLRRRKQKSLFWCPIGVPDEQLDLDNSYANDTERLGAAVQRAVARHERPVELKEIADEIEADPALKLKHYASVSRAVTAAVDYYTETGAPRSEYKYRNKGYFQSVGLLRNKAFYYHCGEGTEQARAYIELRQLELEWKELHADEHLYDLEGCRLPGVAAGRAMMLAAEAERIDTRLRSMIAGGLLVGQWADKAEGLSDLIAGAAERARSWPAAFATNGHKLPKRVSTHIPYVTKEELCDLLAPIYPYIQRKVEKPRQITAILSTRIRRVTVQGMRHRAYDRTDALLFAARRFGGKECCLQAGIAAAELGLLRDPRFIFPAVDSRAVDARLTATACLAYIQSEEGNNLLKQLAMKDAEAGIRQSALWAYAFANGELAKDLASVMSKHDSAEEAREFAVRVYEAEGAAIWQL